MLDFGALPPETNPGRCRGQWPCRCRDISVMRADLIYAGHEFQQEH
jgi:hypothetical protein